MSAEKRRALLLSVGYGQGHHAAAKAVAAELELRGWQTLQMDPCEAGHPLVFRQTQAFYHFCVRRAPWLWGVTYAQTDTADWASAVRRPLMRACAERLRDCLAAFRPHSIVCTYPLFAYMLDMLREEGCEVPPYVVVVTDALEISRPWMLSRAAMFCMPDEHSRRLVLDRYALEEGRVAAPGFPVRPGFRPAAGRPLPTASTLRLVYGAYAPMPQVCDDLRGLCALFPQAHITVLAGERAARLRRLLAAERAGGNVVVKPREEKMAELFARSHIYIGKAGAATMFEAYSAELPCIVNYALPGQEQGNLALLQMDGAGVGVEGTRELLHAVGSMLEQGAARWSAMLEAMRRSRRSGGAPGIADIIEELLTHDA